MHRHIWKVVEKRREATFLEQVIAAGATSVENYQSRNERPSTVVTVRCQRCGSEKVYRV